MAKSVFQIANISIYQYVFGLINSNMYVLLMNDRAVIVDPHENSDAYNLLKGSDVKEVSVLLTHEHYDHISGVNWLRELFSCTVYSSVKCSEHVSRPEKNLSKYFGALLFFNNSEMDKEIILPDVENFSCIADRTFESECRMNLYGHEVWLKELPGHSDGSIGIIIDEKIIFTGDNLTNGFSTITKLPGGDKNKFRSITLPFLNGLPGDYVVFPGHGTIGLLNKLLPGE